ncbi:MAG: GNAT family N-acetyltransferase [Betaproteobacteria bacterium]
MSPYKIRHARIEDHPALQALITRSARVLSQGDYTAQQIELALAGTYGVDSKLISDRTYFVAEDEGGIIGCGGWSRRATLFGGDAVREEKSGDDNLLDPKISAARIRAFFIDPPHARKGIGRALLSRCEEEALVAGFTTFELVATIPGVRLYAACGYAPGERFQHDMNGVKIDFVPMSKFVT